MIFTLIIGILSMVSTIFGHVFSRGAGVGISLFMAIWTTLLAISFLGIILPGKKGIPCETRAIFSFFVWLLWLGQGLIWTTMYFADENDFGYIARDNICLVWIFPLVLAIVSITSIVSFFVANRNQNY